MEWEDIIHQATTKDGRRYQIRHIHWSDLDQLLDFINSLVEAKAEIARIAPVTREEEAEWLKHTLEEEEKGHIRHYVTEMNHKVIGNAELKTRTPRTRPTPHSHPRHRPATRILGPRHRKHSHESDD